MRDPHERPDDGDAGATGVAIAGPGEAAVEAHDASGGDPHDRANGPADPSPAAYGHPNGHANGHANGFAPRGDLAAAAGCTAPQLRRFIKSRPYVPMHELRRRFGINGGEDDVTSVDLSSGRVYVGLPPREGALLGELLRGGEIGYELSLDPRSPVVVGLYPMRPVART